MKKGKLKTYVKRVRLNNKYYVVGVLNGKLVEKARWSSKVEYNKYNQVKSIDVKTAKTEFKQTLSFSPNKRRTVLINKVETVDYTVKVQRGKERTEWRGEKKVKGAKLPRNASMYQWVCEGHVDKYGKTQVIVARSEMHDKGYPFSKAREEAFERFLYKLTQNRMGAYTGDADKGWDQFSKVGRFHEGPIYYTPA